jgi:hypothetical protein
MTGKQCDACPFRRNIEPYLTTERGIGLALMTRGNNGDFHCHETTYGPTMRRRPRKEWRTCIGFALLRGQEAGGRFVQEADEVFMSMGDMIAAYVTRGK